MLPRFVKVLLVSITCLGMSLIGCKKQRYTCGFNYYYVPAYVAFSGFAAADLKTVVIGSYTAGSNFSELISGDTIDASAALFAGDTASASDNYGFFQAKPGVDYKVTLPLAGKAFRITDVRRFEEKKVWEQDEACGSGSQPARIRTCGYKLDGADYTPFERSVNNWYLYLHQ